MIGMDGEAVEMVCSAEFWRMAILWTLSLLYSYLLLVLRGACFFLPGRHQPRSYSHGSSAAPTGRKPICVITGATSGLGAAAAKALAAKGFCVVLVGRSPHLLSKIVERIMEQVKDAQLKGFVVDVSSIRSIIEFKSSLEQWLSECNLHPSIQLLINNAGILARSSRASADGYDQMMGTNYMGAFVLTNILLPLLENSHLPSRIVNVTSFTHRCVSSALVKKELLVRQLYSASAPKRYPFASTYECSKLYLLLFTYALHRKLYMVNSSPKVSIIAADPGVVETRIMREFPICLSRLAFTVLRLLHLLKSPEDGISSIIDAALAPQEASGLYFFGGGGRTIKSSARSYDEKLAEDLWSCSFRLLQEAHSKLGVDEDLLPW